MRDIVKHFPNSPEGLQVAFIDTAAESEPGSKAWLNEDKEALEKVGFEVLEYTLTGKRAEQVINDLRIVDVLFVSGGNTFYLMEQIHRTRFTAFVKDFLEKGGIYIGSSAGSVAAGPDISVIKQFDSPKKARRLKTFRGMGVVDFVTLPHWGSEYYKKKYLHEGLEEAYKNEQKYILLSDMQYIHVQDTFYKIEQVLTAD
jgi:dipeptidase E